MKTLKIANITVNKAHSALVAAMLATLLTGCNTGGGTNVPTVQQGQIDTDSDGVTDADDSEPTNATVAGYTAIARDNQSNSIIDEHAYTYYNSQGLITKYEEQDVSSSPTEITYFTYQSNPQTQNPEYTLKRTVNGSGTELERWDYDYSGGNEVIETYTDSRSSPVTVEVRKKRYNTSARENLLQVNIDTDNDGTFDKQKSYGYLLPFNKITLETVSATTGQNGPVTLLEKTTYTYFGTNPSDKLQQKVHTTYDTDGVTITHQKTYDYVWNNGRVDTFTETYQQLDSSGTVTFEEKERKKYTYNTPTDNNPASAVYQDWLSNQWVDSEHIQFTYANNQIDQIVVTGQNHEAITSDATFTGSRNGTLPDYAANHDPFAEDFLGEFMD